MNITADTNVLVRLLTEDDLHQSRVAIQTLNQASSVVISLHSLCELVWVLGRGYQVARTDIASVIRQLMNTANVVVNKSAVEAGLQLFDAGGDFADGIIAYDGRLQGGNTFVSFDKKAVNLLKQLGHTTQRLK
ncbi:type II toxin-antitoxin system VapC family toxin [Pokkaliibacter sp. MBI-7]|uniref:type II toxin-antitoxin system VapC family toxin n=1 Tax=Pokkaliibacter sp. MBI-7 TaxID=3040600 RepID=UPI0024496167|nr:type II toxin-antitoxin system VapC family toxin [Pokkaliibacter sp. MBI-7]MDH2430944.1 type II toxin-antitoxin system VapC family toxin [Pokkaliibacter sp. MBI-7]MDH2431042.1 type II toxin-antitoxin system VapC family toxin [Pokkaliibacter sp. MBI-7]MDH2434763.1 type II toxin-antitoxin system VapC family toxin [Pokkaliibacter sp. MBI-7]MDH2436681.1 type II toxin-antitoxin system VapC family toxin [Pokkaliibacter sp. MBI-7]MDH2436737.1 type II toxin-antitoxin system VapC family toxin [Pokka